MTKKTQDYWAERFAYLEKRKYESAKEHTSNLRKHYDKAIQDIGRDISDWYRRFASENGVSYAEAKRMLTTDEVKAFRMSIDEYIEKGKSLDPKWLKSLENASIRVHVGRLEALKLHIRHQAEKVSSASMATMENVVRDVYEDQYLRTAFEIHKGTGASTSLSKPDFTKIEKLALKPWAPDGKNFSERVWENRDKLVGTLNTQLTQMVIQGKNPDKVISALTERFNVSYSSASRLVMTESAFFASEAQKDSYLNLGYEKYQILATLDSRTSNICQEMDGKVFDTKDMRAGETAPPFHVNCRSTTVPWFEDEFDIGKRAARDGDGKYILVDQDAKYEDWKKAFIDNDTSARISISPPAPDDFFCKSVLNEWERNKDPDGGKVIERKNGDEFVFKGKTYTINGKHIVYEPSAREKEVAGILNKAFGKVVKLNPRFNFPKEMNVPDYFFGKDEEHLDLKEINGSGGNVVSGAVTKSKEQANSFVIDITKTELSEKEARKQISRIFRSKRADFVERIILVRENDVLDVIERIKK